MEGGTCPTLHIPMYFFLFNLSFLDVCTISTIVPQMLKNLLSLKRNISFQSCITQAYFFVIFLATELLLLAVMVFDRYVAICHPLRYTIIMNWKVCCYLVSGMWLCGVLLANIHVLSLFCLSFCGPSTIKHFFCELPPLLQLSCSDTTFNQYLMLVMDLGLWLLPPDPCLLCLHCFLHTEDPFGTREKEGFLHMFLPRDCGHTFLQLSHLYLCETSFHVPGCGQICGCVVHTVITPILNPLIYSLRNKQVKEAFKRVMRLQRE